MKKLEAYQEAKQICTSYINYTGDKRSFTFKRLQNMVLEVYMGRMNNFGKQLGLPGYLETFFNN